MLERDTEPLREGDSPLQEGGQSPFFVIYLRLGPGLGEKNPGIAECAAPDEGTVKWGRSANVGYLPKEYSQFFDSSG